MCSDASRVAETLTCGCQICLLSCCLSSSSSLYKLAVRLRGSDLRVEQMFDYCSKRQEPDILPLQSFQPAEHSAGRKSFQ